MSDHVNHVMACLIGPECQSVCVDTVSMLYGQDGDKGGGEPVVPKIDMGRDEIKLGGIKYV